MKKFTIFTILMLTLLGTVSSQALAARLFCSTVFNPLNSAAEMAKGCIGAACGLTKMGLGVIDTSLAVGQAMTPEGIRGPIKAARKGVAMAGQAVDDAKSTAEACVGLSCVIANAAGGAVLSSLPGSGPLVELLQGTDTSKGFPEISYDDLVRKSEDASLAQRRGGLESGNELTRLAESPGEATKVVRADGDIGWRVHYSRLNRIGPNGSSAAAYGKLAYFMGLMIEGANTARMNRITENRAGAGARDPVSGHRYDLNPVLGLPMSAIIDSHVVRAEVRPDGSQLVEVRLNIKTELIPGSGIWIEGPAIQQFESRTGGPTFVNEYFEDMQIVGLSAHVPAAFQGFIAGVAAKIFPFLLGFGNEQGLINYGNIATDQHRAPVVAAQDRALEEQFPPGPMVKSIPLSFFGEGPGDSFPVFEGGLEVKDVTTQADVSNHLSRIEFGRVNYIPIPKEVTIEKVARWIEKYVVVSGEFGATSSGDMVSPLSADAQKALGRKDGDVADTVGLHPQIVPGALGAAIGDKITVKEKVVGILLGKAGKFQAYHDMRGKKIVVSTTDSGSSIAGPGGVNGSGVIVIEIVPGPNGTPVLRFFELGTYAIDMPASMRAIKYVGPQIEAAMRSFEKVPWLGSAFKRFLLDFPWATHLKAYSLPNGMANLFRWIAENHQEEIYGR